MNFLAHAYLSFNDPEILAGNMFGDFVKGKKQFLFPDKIRKGITLHRAIDQFTDQHEASAIARQVFKPAVRLYAGAFVDVVYDHFLALDTKEMSPEAWMNFSKKTYAQISLSQDSFPANFSRTFFCMRMQNWLYNYRYEWCIRNSFYSLAFRATYLHANDAGKVLLAFKQEYEVLRDCYARFFPEVKAFARDFIEAS